jgi:hypothetical protein
MLMAVTHFPWNWSEDISLAAPTAKRTRPVHARPTLSHSHKTELGPLVPPGHIDRGLDEPDGDIALTSRVVGRAK